MWEHNIELDLEESVCTVYGTEWLRIIPCDGRL